MKPAVFVSHASQDKEAAAKLCADLQENGVDTWASFKDIEPGAMWNKVIEEALAAATHVIVVVSKNSVASAYVGAEIEWALNQGKKVIPVLIEPVKLPMRWYTLQYTDLSTTSENKDAPFQNLVHQLPRNTRNRFEVLLEQSASIEQLREFLWEHSDLISHSAVSQKQLKDIVEGRLSIVKNTSSRSGAVGMETQNDVLELVQEEGLGETLSLVDFFEYSTGTCTTFTIVYLLNPVPAFDYDGKPTDGLNRCLEDAKKLIVSSKLLSALFSAMVSPHGIRTEVRIISGRRHQIDASELNYRTELEKQWFATDLNPLLGDDLIQIFTKYVFWRGQERFPYWSQLKFTSYDSLLQRV